MYVPFMKKLKKFRLKITIEHNKFAAMIDVTSKNNGHFNKSGYSWNDILVAYELSEMEG
jgi:hypothetical protein